MTLLIMALLAVLVGLTTTGALTWAYFAEDRACLTAESSGSAERSNPSESAEQLELAEPAREVRERMSA